MHVLMYVLQLHGTSDVLHGMVHFVLVSFSFHVVSTLFYTSGLEAYQICLTVHLQRLLCTVSSRIGKEKCHFLRVDDEYCNKVRDDTQLFYP